MCLTRRSLPLLEADEEILFQVGVWSDALQGIPTEELKPAFEFAADSWDWLSRPFTADVIKSAYVELIRARRSNSEAAARKAKFQNPEYSACAWCLDEGYIPVFYIKYGRWYSARRPCCCPACPAAQRLAPISEEAYTRDTLGRYALRSDVERYGYPESHFLKIA